MLIAFSCLLFSFCNTVILNIQYFYRIYPTGVTVPYRTEPNRTVPYRIEPHRTVEYRIILYVYVFKKILSSHLSLHYSSLLNTVTRSVALNATFLRIIR